MTTDGVVPLDRPHVLVHDIRTGAPVRAQTWGDMAALAHWVAGRGTMLVPQHRSIVSLDEGDDVTLRYMVRPQGRAMARVWVFELRGHEGFPGACTFQPLTLPSTVSEAISVEPEVAGTRLAPVVIVEGAGLEDELTRSTADVEIACEVVCTYGKAIIVSCAVWELPRAALTRDATDLAIARDGFFPRRPIHGGVDYESVKGVVDLMASLCASPRRTRSGHIGRWGQRLEVSSGSATPLQKDTPYKIVPGLDRPGAQETEVTCYLFASVASGSAEWRVNVGSTGASSWQSFTNTTAAWLTPIVVDVKCEDPTSSNGYRGGSADTIKWEVRTSGGVVRAYGWGALE